MVFNFCGFAEFEDLNATRMSVAGEGLTEPLFTKLPGKEASATNLASNSKTPDTYDRIRRFLLAAGHPIVDLILLQGVVSVVANGLRCSIFHSSPWGNLPLRFSVSIAYQKEGSKG